MVVSSDHGVTFVFLGGLVVGEVRRKTPPVIRHDDVFRPFHRICLGEFAVSVDRVLGISNVDVPLDQRVVESVDRGRIAGSFTIDRIIVCDLDVVFVITADFAGILRVLGRTVRIDDYLDRHRHRLFDPVCLRVVVPYDETVEEGNIDQSVEKGRNPLFFLKRMDITHFYIFV